MVAVAGKDLEPCIGALSSHAETRGLAEERLAVVEVLHSS